MTVLPGVPKCRILRRTVQVRLGFNPAVRGTVARWNRSLHGLATAIHETSGLVFSLREAFSMADFSLEIMIPYIVVFSLE